MTSKTRARIAGDRFVLVMIWPLVTDYGRYEFQELHRWVGEQARANGFEVIDLLSEFSRVWYRELQASAEDNVEDSTYQRRSPVQSMGFTSFFAFQQNHAARLQETIS